MKSQENILKTPVLQPECLSADRSPTVKKFTSCRSASMWRCPFFKSGSFLHRIGIEVTWNIFIFHLVPLREHLLIILYLHIRLPIYSFFLVLSFFLFFFFPCLPSFTLSSVSYFSHSHHFPNLLLHLLILLNRLFVLSSFSSSHSSSVSFFPP
jgi:hypothetical protein